jgi:hypothetical protein
MIKILGDPHSLLFRFLRKSMGQVIQYHGPPVFENIKDQEIDTVSKYIPDPQGDDRQQPQKPGIDIIHAAKITYSTMFCTSSLCKG